MNCNCSLNNNYQIIGLCDIESIGNKGVFVDGQALKEFILNEQIIIPKNKPDIEDVNKVYVNGKIESSKVIVAPFTPNKNVEGLFTRGYKLIVRGYICQKIIYTSNTTSQKLYSLTSETPFCTYIVLKRPVDIDNDNYCVKICIEDVMVRLLNPRTIFESISLVIIPRKSSNSTC